MKMGDLDVDCRSLILQKSSSPLRPCVLFPKRKFHLGKNEVQLILIAVVDYRGILLHFLPAIDSLESATEDSRSLCGSNLRPLSLVSRCFREGTGDVLDIAQPLWQDC